MVLGPVIADRSLTVSSSSHKRDCRHEQVSHRYSQESTRVSRLQPLQAADEHTNT